MEENKATTQTENTQEAEVKVNDAPEVETKVNDTEETKPVTEVKKPNTKKYFTIFAISFLALVIIAN